MFSQHIFTQHIFVLSASMTSDLSFRLVETIKLPATPILATREAKEGEELYHYVFFESRSRCLISTFFVSFRTSFARVLEKWVPEMSSWLPGATWVPMDVGEILNPPLK